MSAREVVDLAVCTLRVAAGIGVLLGVGLLIAHGRERVEGWLDGQLDARRRARFLAGRWHDGDTR